MKVLGYFVLTILVVISIAMVVVALGYYQIIPTPHRCINPGHNDVELPCTPVFSSEFWTNTGSRHIEWFK